MPSKEDPVVSGEDAFLADLFSRMPAVPADVIVPPGDDCAAVDNGDGSLTLLAVDQIVGGRHYVLDDSQPPPESIGKKLLARNLSDIAAMGGVPRFCLVSLATPKERTCKWLSRVLLGIVELAKKYDVHMIGGDLARTQTDEVGSLTIVGQMPANQVCRRNGAGADCVLMATGAFGGAVTSGHHLTFLPRLNEGKWLAETGCCEAMIDVSDGLLLDADRIARASGVKLVLDCESIPRRFPDLNLQNALGDGEDYELLVAVKEKNVRKIMECWPFDETSLTVIGHFQSGNPGVFDSSDNDLLARFNAGYDHLKSTADG